MRFLYVAPRYHTNQVPIIRGLKRKGHEVCFLSQYAGKVEDYSDLTPTVIGYSRIFLFFDRIYVALMKNRDAYAGDRKMKCGFPPIGKLKRAIRDSHGDVAVLRERSVYSICAYLLCKKYKIPAILYNQSPLWVGCCRLSNIAVTLRVRVGTPAEVPKKINSMSSSRFKKYSG